MGVSCYTNADEEYVQLQGRNKFLLTILFLSCLLVSIHLHWIV